MSRFNALPIQLLDALKDKQHFPIGTLAYYGPDDHTATKVTASVISGPDSEIIMRDWIGENLSEDEAIVAEIRTFLQSYEVVEVVMTHGIVGCPHVEGVDFPMGDQCPECPFWLEHA